MRIFIKKVSILVGLTLCVIASARGQIVTSARDGLWNDPATWDSGQVPEEGNAIETVVNHNVVIPEAMAITISNVVVNGSLTVGAGAVVDIQPDAMPERNDLQVFGTLVMSDGAALNGTTVSNTSFEDGARYIHLQGPLGFIPYATWHNNSTFVIAGFKAQGYINIAHSDSWKQNFGHVVYNCAQQTTAFVDLNGYLRNIAGNFIVENTNNQVLRLSTTQNPVISIGGDFIVQGSSKIWLSTSPTGATVNVGDNLRYLSTSSGISYLTTKGVVNINVSGDFEMDSPGRIHMASTSADSTGARRTTINLIGNLNVVNGTIIGPPPPGKGTVRFSASGSQAVVTSPTGTTFTGAIDYVIEPDAIVDLGTSVLSNSSGTLHVKGTLQVGSTHSLGAIQTATAGNIQVQGTRLYEPGATIEYNGAGPQWIGNGHPSTPGVNLICANPSGITVLQGIIAGDFTALADVDMQSFSLTVDGNIFSAPGVNCLLKEVNLIGVNEQQVSAFGNSILSLHVDKPSNGVALTSELIIKEKLLIVSPNTSFHSGGHLVLSSTSDGMEGTACVGPLPAGSSVSGDVTVQRHMAGEGRIFRYISSPVQNASVESLKDDFPVTGHFADPSGGSGTPSLFYYDQSVGGLTAGWRSYPAAGMASANPLVIGRGYSARIRKASGPTIIDFTGPLNQGTIDLPVQFTPDGQPSNGWNLVGNPYPCALQWDETGGEKWSLENISSVIAIRDNGGGGTFKYFDMDDNYSTDEGGQIASCQAFWVRATGLNPKLTIREGVKTVGGAEFFRSGREPIPSFALSLTRDSFTDVAYYKVRPSASRGLDDWDGLKMDNDIFDLAIMTPDNFAMAIHATNKLPCDTTIQLKINDLTKGTYSLSLSTRYNFTRYNFVLVDKYLQKEIKLEPDSTVKFTVTSDPASFAVNRMSLKLTEKAPRTDLTIAAPSSTCEDAVVGLRIVQAEAGILYSVFAADSVLLASGMTDSPSDLIISFSASELQPGHNLLSVKAHATCHVVPLLGTHAIIREATPEIWAEPATACSGSSVILKASTDNRDAQIFWFHEPTSRDTIGIGSHFTTETLVKSKTYYVSASASGCSSRRIAAYVEVRNYAPAEISILGDTLICSNYDTGVSWMFNGERIQGGDQCCLRISLPGVYQLQVDTIGCSSRATFEFNPLELTAVDHPLSAYPNPATDVLVLRMAESSIDSIEIIDFHGRKVLSEKFEGTKRKAEYPVTVSELASGSYLVLVTTLGRRQAIRFIKKD